jgi:Flp pilus assembly protein TadD
LLKQAFDSFSSNEIEAATSAFEAAVALQPDNALANTFSAICLAQSGKLEEAEALARRAVALAPDQGLTHYVLALVLTAREAFDEAETQLWEAVAADPASAFLRLELAKTLITRNSSEALRQAQHAAELSPDEPEPFFTLGALQTADRKFRLATKNIERVLELRPHHARGLALYGLLQAVQADGMLKTPPKLEGFKRAVCTLRRALELDPDNELAKEHLKIAEDAVERISKPSSSSAKVKSPRRELIGQALVFGGMATLACLMVGLLYWFDGRGEDLLTAFAIILAMELGAFLLMLYIKRDFSALPPSLYRIGERVLKQTPRVSPPTVPGPHD